MIAVVQRVISCAVTADKIPVSDKGAGLLILLGVACGDSERDADALSAKIAKMRIFEDENGKMNKSVTDIGGSVTVVPNFTLLAAYKKGNRPDFLASAKPDTASPLFEYFKKKISELCGECGSGVFGADMKISAVCDGPVTITMDSKVLLG